MGRLGLTIAFIICASAGAIDDARADALKPVQRAINDSLNAARKDEGKCRMATLKGLKDARDGLEQNRQSATAAHLSKVRRSVEDAYDLAASECNEATQQHIQRALDAVSAALKSQQAAEATPTTADKKLHEARSCWNYKNDRIAVDPACHTPRQGHYPMGKAEFLKLVTTLKSHRDRFEKATAAEQLLGYNQQKYVSATQMGEVLPLLMHDVDRAELVKTVAARIVDLHNAAKLGRHFKDARSRQEAMDAINQQLR